MALDCRIGRIYPRYPRRRGALSRQQDESLHAVLRSFHQRFHAAVHAIANPAGQAQASRRLHRPVAVEHALNRSEEHTSELQSLMRISYAVFFLKKKTNIKPLSPT